MKYICRLNNHLSHQEISERIIFQTTQRINCNSFVIQKQLKAPSVWARDVYEKVVYDVVRRDQGIKDNKNHPAPDPTKSKSKLTRSELQMLNVLIPKNKRKDNVKKTVQFEAHNNEISKAQLGDSKYEDWYEVESSLYFIKNR